MAVCVPMRLSGLFPGVPFLLVLPTWGIHPIRQSLVDYVNEKQSDWVAAQPAENPLSGFSEEDLRGMLGVVPDGKKNSNFAVYTPSSVNTPAFYDARDAFPSCPRPVRDQGKCGSCWAVAAAETLRFNRCASRTASEPETPILSSQDLVSCDTLDMGCKGGVLLFAWIYILDIGLRSSACDPYVSGDGASNGTCSPVCTGDTQADQTYGCTNVFFAVEREPIKLAVFYRGAVEASFTVYEDFFSYKSGVYRHVSGGAAGGHAVVVVGFGHQEGTFYWLVQNSWGSSWGEDGYFKIVAWEVDPDSGFARDGVYFCLGPLNVLTA